MIEFEPSNINLKDTPQENIRKLRSYLEELTDKLNFLSEKVDNLEKARDK